MRPETYLVAAVGCKVNQYEAQQLREALESYGLRPVSDSQVPDVAVINTCAVTRTAERKSRQLVRRWARTGRAQVIVLGCGPAADRERFAGIDGVVAVASHEADLVSQLARILGADESSRPHNDLSAPVANSSIAVGVPGAGRRHPDTSGATAGTEVGALDASAAARDTPIQLNASDSHDVKWGLSRTVRGHAGRHRAFLKIQDGCDAGCTYCLIPSLRTRLRSKPPRIAREEARRLVDQGYLEIVLTGIFLGAYGKRTSRRSRHRTRDDSVGSAPASEEPLTDLVEALSGIAGLARLRLSSIEPSDVSDRLLAVMASRPTCAPHLHLPLQSGSDAVLRRMNRQYHIGEYLETIDRVKAALDLPALTTDVIVGFPGETEEEFDETLDVIRRVGFARVHAFPFSLRRGTAAERWRDQLVPDEIVRERMQRVQALADETARAFRRPLVGRTERVLVETRAKPQSDSRPNRRASEAADDQAGIRWRGRCDRYVPVTVLAPASPDRRGRVESVLITDAETEHLTGMLETKPVA